MKSIQTESYQLLISMLRDKRQDAGFTQDDLAARIKIDQTFVSKYETGERRLDVIELKKVCEALGLTLGKFIDEFENRNSKL